MQDNKTPADEIRALAESEGLTLPFDAETIERLERVGCVVDLETGAIYPGGDRVRYRPTVRVLGLLLAAMLVWLPLVLSQPAISAVRCEPHECRVTP